MPDAPKPQSWRAMPRSRCSTDGSVPSPSYQHHSHEAPLFGRLDRLTVDDSCGGIWASALRLSDVGAQCLMDSFPRSIQCPPTEVLVHCWPREAGRAVASAKRIRSSNTYSVALTTSRRSTVRGLPPGLAGGNNGARIFNWLSVRSLGYRLRVMTKV